MNSASLAKGKRELVKFSGEVLGNHTESVHAPSVLRMAQELAAFRDQFGIQLAAMPGAGNHFRGRDGENATPKERSDNDFIGMGYTVINAYAVTEALNQIGVPAICMSVINDRDLPAEMRGKSITPYHRVDAISALVTGRVVVLGGGSGRVGTSTDGAGKQLAAEIGANFIKGTNAPGVCNRDPRDDSHPEPLQVFQTMPFEYAFRNELGVFDPLSLALLTQSGIDQLRVLVYDARNPGGLISSYLRHSGTLLYKDAPLKAWEIDPETNLFLLK